MGVPFVIPPSRSGLPRRQDGRLVFPGRHSCDGLQGVFRPPLKGGHGTSISQPTSPPTQEMPWSSSAAWLAPIVPRSFPSAQQPASLRSLQMTFSSWNSNRDLPGRALSSTRPQRRNIENTHAVAVCRTILLLISDSSAIPIFLSFTNHQYNVSDA